jgi:hypothetical protein
VSTSHSTLKAIDEESNNLPHIYYIDNSQNLTQKASESQCVDASGIKLVNCIFSHNPASQCEAFSKLPVFKKREFLTLSEGKFGKYCSLLRNREIKKTIY